MVGGMGDVDGLDGSRVRRVVSTPGLLSTDVGDMGRDGRNGRTFWVGWVEWAGVLISTSWGHGGEGSVGGVGTGW